MPADGPYVHGLLAAGDSDLTSQLTNILAWGAGVVSQLRSGRWPFWPFGDLGKV